MGTVWRQSQSLYYYSDLMLSLAFQPMILQLSYGSCSANGYTDCNSSWLLWWYRPLYRWHLYEQSVCSVLVLDSWMPSAPHRYLGTLRAWKCLRWGLRPGRPVYTIRPGGRGVLLMPGHPWFNWCCRGTDSWVIIVVVGRCRASFR